jgi:hypothetical protein
MKRELHASSIAEIKIYISLTSERNPPLEATAAKQPNKWNTVLIVENFMMSCVLLD